MIKQLATAGIITLEALVPEIASGQSLNIEALNGQEAFYLDFLAKLNVKGVNLIIRDKPTVDSSAFYKNFLLARAEYPINDKYGTLSPGLEVQRIDVYKKVIAYLRGSVTYSLPGNNYFIFFQTESDINGNNEQVLLLEYEPKKYFFGFEGARTEDKGKPVFGGASLRAGYKISDNFMVGAGANLNYCDKKLGFDPGLWMKAMIKRK